MLWCPRAFQGRGRHDAPERYGAVYAAEDPRSAVAEQLAPFRGRRLRPEMLRRRGLPLALCRYGAPAALVDLDDPAVLLREDLLPSQVATRARGTTQAQARRLFDAHPDAAGIRWWSTLEAAWINVTLFDVRAAGRLRPGEARPLAAHDPLVAEVAGLLGLT